MASKAKVPTVEANGVEVTRVRYEDVVLDHSRNIRPFDPAHARTTADLIKVNGLTRVPTLVREEGKLYVERGFHTWSALGLIREEIAGAFADVAVEIIETVDEVERRLLHMVEQMSKRDLTQAEIAENVSMLSKCGLGKKVIATRLGQSGDWVNEALHFHKAATAELKQLSKDAKIVNGAAQRASRLPAEQQKAVALNVSAGRSAHKAIDEQRAAVGMHVGARKLGRPAVLRQVEERGIAARANEVPDVRKLAAIERTGDVEMATLRVDDLELALDAARSAGILAGAAWVLGLVADPEVAAEDGTGAQALADVDDAGELGTLTDAISGKRGRKSTRAQAAG